MTPTEIAAIEARVAAADGVRVRGWKKKAADVALVQVTGGPEQNIDPWIMQAAHAPTDLARLLADRRELEARATAAEAALADAVARERERCGKVAEEGGQYRREGATEYEWKWGWTRPSAAIAAAIREPKP